jgi:hypothetical protein
VNIVSGESNLNGTIIGYRAPDGLLMKGYLALSSGNYATVIHIHGACGNFYENGFLPVMAQSYVENGINFLTVNTRGHDCMAEAYKDGKLVYIGGAYEIVEESNLDIEGVVRFARKFGSKIILQGHSSGCHKILYYLVKSKNDFDFILLSPTDPYMLQQNYIYPEKIEEQLARIKREYADRLDEILPPQEHGCRQGGVEYSIPITARALIAFLEGPGIKVLRYDNPSDYFLKSNAFIYYGAADPLWEADRKKVEQFFLKQIENVHFFILENGDHHFHGSEKCVADEIVKWILGKNAS